MEPILVKYASHHGFSPRFSTELVSAERDSETGEWLCQVKDHLRKDSYIVRTKFLFGADGGRSPVAKAAEATFASRPSLGVACNVLFDADVSHLMQGRHAQLHTISKAISPDTPLSLADTASSEPSGPLQIRHRPR